MSLTGGGLSYDDIDGYRGRFTLGYAYVRVVTECDDDRMKARVEVD